MMIRRTFFRVLAAAVAALVSRPAEAAPPGLPPELLAEIEQALATTDQQRVLFGFRRGPDGSLTYRRSYL